MSHVARFLLSLLNGDTIVKTEEPMPVLRSSKDQPTSSRRHKDQDKEQCPITVYKIVSVIDGHRESLAMMQACSAIYTPGQIVSPPIPNSPLFAYRTLEIAQQEWDRLVEVNSDRPFHFTAPPMEIWLAQTTG